MRLVEFFTQARLATVAGFVALVGALWLAAPAHSHPAVGAIAPLLGDWEARGGEASFAVVTRRVHGVAGVAVRDATFSLSRRCSGSGGGAIIVTRPAVPVGQKGTFSYRRLRQTPGVGQTLETFSGRFVSRTAVIVRVREMSDVSAPSLPPARCDTGTVVLHLRAASRRPVADGIYRGTTANGEPVQVRVTQGGRLISAGVGAIGLIPSVQVGTWTATCSAQSGCSSSAPPGDACARQLPDSIWIDAAGTFNLTPADPAPGVAGSFTGGTMRGTLSYPSSETSCSAPFTATTR